jgi:hypothetical protein
MTDHPHDSVAPPPPPSPGLPPPPAPSTFPAMTLAAPPGEPAFHPRGVLVSRALGGPLNRVNWVAGISAVLFVLALSTILGAGSPFLLLPVLAAIGAIAGVTLGVATMPAKSRRAFETFAWLGRREMNRFEARTGTKVPTTPETAQRWLEANPRSSATAFGRLELLAMLGRTNEAAAEQALLPSPTTDSEAVEQALARCFTAFIASGTVDESELDGLQAGLRPDTELVLELLVGRAILEARGRLAQGREDWRDPLVAVRPRLGSAATMTVVRDLWIKIALLMFFVALAVGVVTATWPL